MDFGKMTKGRKAKTTDLPDPFVESTSFNVYT